MLDITCKMCRGRCCTLMPGIASPEDFGAPDRDVMRARIADVLHSGRWSIDRWAADDEWPNMLYLRPATICGAGLVLDFSWGGQCTFLTIEGCAIYPSRPYGCRDLVSGPPCLPATDAGTKLGGARSWLPYQDLLIEQAEQAEE